MGKVWENKDREICQGCNSRVDTGQFGLECGACRRWYHANCEKLTKKDYDKICEIDDKILWHCGKCGDILPMILTENRKLHKELAVIKREMLGLKGFMMDVKGGDSTGNNFQEDLSDLKKRIEEQL